MEETGDKDMAIDICFLLITEFALDPGPAQVFNTA